MRMKKVLAAAGIVCLVAPAAAAVILTKQGRATVSDAQSHIASLVGLRTLESVQRMLADAETSGERRTASDGEQAAGEVRSLFTSLSKVIAPNLTGPADLVSLFGAGGADASIGGDGSLALVSLDGASGPIGRRTAAPQSGGPSDGRSPSMGGVPNGSGGLFGRGGGGAGGGGGGSGGGTADGPAALAAEVSQSFGPDGAPITAGNAVGVGVGNPITLDNPVTVGAPDDGLLVTPLPASIWMLLASVAGLGFVSYRRGAAPS